MTNILRKFPNDPAKPRVVQGDGMYLLTEDGRRVLDMTAGTTTFSVLGFSHPVVKDAMRAQMDKFCHIDYNTWVDPNLESLATVLLSRAPRGLDKVYFPGNSGSEAMEAAMKLSYHVHHDSGKPGKTHYIARLQSFHGATLHGIAISELPILSFYEPLLPPNRSKIPQHDQYINMLPGESLDDYARRSAKQLEDKILEIGPDKVCAFIGETMLANLIGDVAPAPNYWKYVREVCDRYDVHLILDEIYCGLGRSGRVYCCDWDDVTPDFVCIGKNLAAGYAPLSAVVCNHRVEEIIAKGQGRIQHGHTHQGYSLGVAAALAVQTIVQTDETLNHIQAMGARIRGIIESELGAHPYFKEVRGRGLLQSFAYDCPDRHAFSLEIGRRMLDEHNIFVSAKWHRTSFSPAYIVTPDVVDRAIGTFVQVFRQTADDWSKRT